MQKYKLTDSDYWDGVKEHYVIYFPCKQDSVPTKLLIDAGDSQYTWLCCLIKAKLVNCYNKIGDLSQKYKCIYTKS